MPSRLNLSYLSVGSRLCEQVPSDEMVEGLPLIHNHSPSDHTLGSRLQAGVKSWETGGSSREWGICYNCLALVVYTNMSEVPAIGRGLRLLEPQYERVSSDE